MANTLHEARVDFIKRLFAVALSVGFASRLSALIQTSTKNHSIDIPNLWEKDWRGLVLLFAASIVVVASWEAYLNAVSKHKLEDRARFYLDIMIVLSYLVLLLTSDLYVVWFWIIPVIFALYVVWGVARIVYINGLIVAERTTGDINDAWESFRASATWLLFFIVLAWWNPDESPTEFALRALLAVYGVITYRRYKKYSMWGKLVAVLLPFLLVIVYAKT